MKPAKLAATVSSKTTGQLREAGLAAPSSAVERSRRLAADRLGVERRRRAAHAEAEPGLAVAVGLGDRREVGVAGGRLIGARDAARGGERGGGALVDEDGRLDRDHARVGVAGGALDRLRELDLALGRPLGGARVGEPGDRLGLAGGLGRGGELVGVGDPRRLDRGGGDLADAASERSMP